jgi:type IV pilus assembly protein PilC
VPTTYAYKVRDREGHLHKGQMEAESTTLVLNKLREMGMTPISVDKRNVGFSSELTIPLLGKRVKLKELAVFSRQFATMIDAGLTLTRALAILVGQTPNKYFASVIDRIRADVESGLSLSQALGRHPKIFSPLYVSMIRSGETGGSLDGTLLQLATTLEKQVELRGKIRSAMSYPVSVFALVTVILTIMLVFIVPIFKKMYASLTAKLPAPTLLLVKISDVAVILVPILAVCAVIGFAVFRRWVATERGKLAWDRFKLRLPIVGPLSRKTAMTRFAGTFATLLRSGVPLLEALDITSAAVNNAVVARGIADAAEGAKQGEQLTRSLSEHEVFPHMVVQMMAVGEETGALDEMLLKVAEFYQQEVEATIDSLTSILEPLMVVVLGTVVGGIVIALYLPMFDIYKAVQNS